MGEVRVVGIRVEQPQNQPVLLLRESNGDRYLPIWIGQSEAAAIALEQQGVEPARPLTHDLIRDLIAALGHSLKEVRIVDLQEGTFYADLIFDRDIKVSARPSDSVAIALRVGVPIYVEEAVLARRLQGHLTFRDNITDASQLTLSARHAARVSRNGDSGSHTLMATTSSQGSSGSVCSTHSSFGKRAAVQVTDASSIGERIREVVDTPRQEQLELSSNDGAVEPAAPSPSEPVQAGLFPDDSVPDELVGYRGPSACQIAGITYRQLDYWARTSLVVPSIRSAAGSGSQRLYSFKDILVLKIVKRLLDTGISLHNIRVAVDHLRQRGVRDLANITLFSDGTTVYECTSAEEVVDLLQGGQGVFGIAVSGAMRELTGAIADFPGERADGGESISAPEDELASRRKNRDRKIG
jgi:bifunctional DNase/RNase/DNA-binding transcriptional MerR regulator